MRFFLQECIFFCIFVPDFEKQIINALNIMEFFKKYLGVCLLILGVLCLVVYKYAAPENWLLVCSMVLEVGGILAYIFINKKG